MLHKTMPRQLKYTKSQKNLNTVSLKHVRTEIYESLYMQIFKHCLGILLLHFIFCFNIAKNSDCKQDAP